MHNGSLKPEAPYNFDALLAFLARYAYPTMDLAHEGAYRRVIRQGESLALAEVRSAGSVDAPRLDVSVLAQRGEIDFARLRQQLAYVLSIEHSQAAFFSMARADVTLWAVVEPLYGLPSLRSPNVFELLVDVIIEQQILWTAAQRAQRWLIDWGGDFLEHEGLKYYAYPTPAQIAAASVEDLKPLKITFKRMQLLIDLAQRIEDGDLYLDALAEQSSDERYQALLAIKGIGPWTAAVTLARAFGHSGFVGENDVALQAAVSFYFYGSDQRCSAQVVRDTFAAYGDFAGLAAHYTLVRCVMERY